MAGKKVLIVEDEKDLGRHMKRMVEMKGGRAFIAAGAEDALKIVKTKKPDVCLIDIHMPSGPDGIEILKSIKALNAAARCLMITCVDEKGYGEEAQAAGAEGYFVKPLDSVKIQRIIEQIL